MLEIYNKIKDEKIKEAKTKNNILYIKTDIEEYKLNPNFLNEYDIFATVSRYHDPIWGIRKKAS